MVLVPRLSAPRRRGQLTAWYDALNDWQRVLVGLGIIVFLGSSVLYCLGLASMVLVRRVAQQPIPTRVARVITPTPGATLGAEVAAAVEVETPQPSATVASASATPGVLTPTPSADEP